MRRRCRGYPAVGPVGVVVEKAIRHTMALSERNGAFGRLFQHINDDIPMTAPVEMSQTTSGNVAMGFVESPAVDAVGEQDNITVVDRAEQTVLSMAVRGGKIPAN